MELSVKEMEGVFGYQSGDRLIQECLPELAPSEREFIKTGYCGKCQELLFGAESSRRILKFTL